MKDIEEKEYENSLDGFRSFLDDQTKRLIMEFLIFNFKMRRKILLLAIGMVLFEGGWFVFASIHFKRFDWVAFTCTVLWLIWLIICISKFKLAKLKLKNGREKIDDLTS